jgi:hypothetical protein
MCPFIRNDMAQNISFGDDVYALLRVQENAISFARFKYLLEMMDVIRMFLQEYYYIIHINAHNLID